MPTGRFLEQTSPIEHGSIICGTARYLWYRQETKRQTPNANFNQLSIERECPNRPKLLRDCEDAALMVLPRGCW